MSIKKTNPKSKQPSMQTSIPTKKKSLAKKTTVATKKKKPLTKKTTVATKKKKPLVKKTTVATKKKKPLVKKTTVATKKKVLRKKSFNNKPKIIKQKSRLAGKRIAVILAGCGSQDGTEITEAVACLIALSAKGLEIDMFAPNRIAATYANHLTQEEQITGQRHILVESARIARGNIKPLTDLNLALYEGICFPGGYGAAKVLCDFAFKGKDAVIQDDVKGLISQCLSAKKIIGALCIAPMLLALATRDFGIKNVKITLGSDGSDAAKIAQELGATHKPCKANEACLDHKNRFVTAPAYMSPQAKPCDIYASAQALVDGISKLIKKG